MITVSAEIIVNLSIELDEVREMLAEWNEDLDREDRIKMPDLRRELKDPENLTEWLQECGYGENEADPTEYVESIIESMD